MIRLLALLLLLLPVPLTGCFDGNSNGNHADGNDNDGNVEAPHPVDGSYLDGKNHGPDAKADLTACQACHGQPGGPGSNPRFNIGITRMDSTGCEACHGVNYAHPADWAGPNDTFHYSAGNIQKACTLCHGAALDGRDGVGVSCLGCHDSTTVFTLDCTFCHGYPPDGTADVATGTGVDHTNVADVSQHDTCVMCHGMKESDTGGGFAVVTNYLLFDKTTDTIGDHWNGSIDMNSSTGYNQANFGCTTSCHGNDADHQLSDSGLPVELKDFGFDETVPHPVDISFYYPQLHGPAAKGQTAAFPGGLADCQPCHAVPQSGANPRFNIGLIYAGGNGCEACHNDLTAHPSAGTRDKIHWYGAPYTHSDVTDFITICSPCHGANLEGAADGGVGPACTDCHIIDPVANPSGCVSCHNPPPDSGAPAGNIPPNRQGQHDSHIGLFNVEPDQACGGCHTASDSKTHFNGVTNVVIAPAYDAKTGGPAMLNPDNTCSGVSCHGGQITPDWWTGSIEVETECTSCHAFGSTQYNSYYSGEHDTHVLVNDMPCTVCHNPAPLAADHFSGLDTPEFEGDPGDTISGSSIRSYNSATNSCTPTCHFIAKW